MGMGHVYEQSLSNSRYISGSCKRKESCQKVMVRCQVNCQTTLSRKYRLHKVALLIPSNSEQRLIKDQRTCGGKIHKPMGKRKTK